MTFEVVIDTGLEVIPRRAADCAPMWLIDMCPENYSPEQIAQAYAHHLIGDMARPKKMETVRKHILAAGPFLLRLGEEQPGLFDEILCAYVERFLGGE